MSGCGHPRRRLSAGFGRAACAGFALLLTFLTPAAAHACTVCYGKADGSMIDGARLSVLFMLGLVYLLLVGGIAMFVVTRRRRLTATPAPAGEATGGGAVRR